MSVFDNYNCDGQMSMFDYIEQLKTRDDCKGCYYNENDNNDKCPYDRSAYQKKDFRQCKIDSTRPCNRENLTWIARDLGMKCKSKCCHGCPERKICGAACNQAK